MYAIAQLPAIQRDLFLARCLRREQDAPACSTLEVRWPDTVVSFSTDEAISEATVEVAEDVSLAELTPRLESLLDCAKTEGAAEWVLKYCTRISDFGSADESRRLLCDKVASINGETGETVGVLKIRRRSVSAGHAKIRLVPAEDSLQLVCRHTSAQGLKAVWKSAFWRLQPQHSTDGRPEEVIPVDESSGITIKLAPSVVIEGKSDWTSLASEASRMGAEVDIVDARENGVSVRLPLEANNLMGFGKWAEDGWGSPKKYKWEESRNTGRYKAVVRLHHLPAGLPRQFFLSYTGEIVLESTRYTDFRAQAQLLSGWLDLGWDLPLVPTNTNENPPKEE